MYNNYFKRLNQWLYITSKQEAIGETTYLNYCIDDRGYNC